MTAALRVCAIAAISLDGRITRHDEQGTAFTSPQDKAWFGNFLRQFDCSICGRLTYEASRAFILSQLGPERRRIVLTGNPRRFAADEKSGQLEFREDTPQECIQYLETQGHRSCALLGGTWLYSDFFAAGLVDELWITLEPGIFGQGRPLAEGIALDSKWTLKSFDRLGEDTLLLQYLPRRN
jgi:dihydrofolate reductase